MLAEPRDGRGSRHRSEREDQLVVLELLVTAVRARHANGPARGIGAGEPRQHHMRARELLAQRDHDVARLERPRRGAGQQRRVQQVVDVGHERDVRALRRQDPLEPAGGVEAAEATAGDDDAPGHVRWLPGARELTRGAQRGAPAAIHPAREPPGRTGERVVGDGRESGLVRAKR